MRIERYDCNHEDFKKPSCFNKKFTNQPLDLYKKSLGADGRISKDYSNFPECRIYTFNELRKYKEYGKIYKPFISILFSLASVVVILFSLFESKLSKVKIKFFKN